jgi:hypothetical protein
MRLKEPLRRLPQMLTMFATEFFLFCHEST